jgi:hypothetical protein
VAIGAAAYVGVMWIGRRDELGWVIRRGTR